MKTEKQLKTDSQLHLKKQTFHVTVDTTSKVKQQIIKEEEISTLYHKKLISLIHKDLLKIKKTKNPIKKWTKHK